MIQQIKQSTVSSVYMTQIWRW